MTRTVLNTLINVLNAIVTTTDDRQTLDDTGLAYDTLAAEPLLGGIPMVRHAELQACRKAAYIRLRAAEPPTIDDNTKFVVMRRRTGLADWETYHAAVSWRTAQDILRVAQERLGDTGEFRVALWA